ncbi:MAG TPA: DUF2935 domain-containing protein [Firmicutes bacterium]|nr:DUF2935 domain-containing protein [Bacillota bacterium]
MPTSEEIGSLLAQVRFWADIQSEHARILLTVLPRLRPIYANELSSFQRRFADLVSQVENIELRLRQSPQQQTELLAQAATLVREAQRLNEEFLTFLGELMPVYPETDSTLLLNHMRMESRHLGAILLRLELALPPQSQPLPPETVESFLRKLVFWTKDQREHSQLLRATLPGLTAADRENLLRFEREWRALELSARRLLEALSLPGQVPEAITAEVRRLALMARNLVLEYLRFLEELLGRYTDPNSRFLLRHMMKEARRFTEDLRASRFLIF